MKYSESVVCQADVSSNPSRRSSFSQEDSWLLSRLKMVEDSQKEMRHSQKEIREIRNSQKELKYELNKAIVDSQTQTRQLIESLLTHRSPEASKFSGFKTWKSANFNIVT